MRRGTWVILLWLCVLSVAAADNNCVRLDVQPFPAMQFGTLTTLDAKTLNLRLAHTGGFFSGDQQGDLRLERFLFSKTGDVTLSDDSEVIRRSGEFYDLKVTIPAGRPVGPFGARVIIKGFKSVDGHLAAQETKFCEVGVQASIVRPLDVSPATANFGSVQGAKDILLELKPNVAINLQQIKASPDSHFSFTALSASSLPAGQPVPLHVFVKPDAPITKRPIHGLLKMDWKTSTGQPFTVSVPLEVAEIVIGKPAPAGPDLTVEFQNVSVEPPAAGANKSTMKATLKITNGGEASLPCEATVQLDGNVEATVQVGPVAAQGSATVDAEFKTRKTGAHTLSAIVDSNNANSETNENNNGSAPATVDIPG